MPRIRDDHDRWRPGTNLAVMPVQTSNIEVIEPARRARQTGPGPKGAAPVKSLADRVARARAQGFAMCRRDDHAPVDPVAVPRHVPHAVAPDAAAAAVTRTASAMRGGALMSAPPPPGPNRIEPPQSGRAA